MFFCTGIYSSHIYIFDSRIHVIYLVYWYIIYRTHTAVSKHTINTSIINYSNKNFQLPTANCQPALLHVGKRPTNWDLDPSFIFVLSDWLGIGVIDLLLVIFFISQIFSWVSSFRTCDILDTWYILLPRVLVYHTRCTRYRLRTWHRYTWLIRNEQSHLIW